MRIVRRYLRIGLQLRIWPLRVRFMPSQPRRRGGRPCVQGNLLRRPSRDCDRNHERPVRPYARARTPRLGGRCASGRLQERRRQRRFPTRVARDDTERVVHPGRGVRKCGVLRRCHQRGSVLQHNHGHDAVKRKKLEGCQRPHLEMSFGDKCPRRSALLQARHHRGNRGSCRIRG